MKDPIRETQAGQQPESSGLLYAEFEKRLLHDLNGYHLEIMIYPSGGVIEAQGCEECGTDDKRHEAVIWNIKRKTTIDDAVEELKLRLGI